MWQHRYALRLLHASITPWPFESIERVFRNLSLPLLWIDRSQSPLHARHLAFRCKFWCGKLGSPGSCQMLPVYREVHDNEWHQGVAIFAPVGNWWMTSIFHCCCLSPFCGSPVSLNDILSTCFTLGCLILRRRCSEAWTDSKIRD